MDTSIATDITRDPPSQSLVTLLKDRQRPFEIENGNLYYDFPLYRDEEVGGLITTKVLLVSRNHGVVVWGTTDSIDVTSPAFRAETEALDDIFSQVLGRLIKNRKLRRTKQELVVPLTAAIYAPSLRRPPEDSAGDTEIVTTDHQVEELLQSRTVQAIPDNVFAELVSTIEGAKGLIRPVKRLTESLHEDSKGALAAKLEVEITNFDRRQKKGYIIAFDGPQRVRGLAGSGKTVVLAMKAAVTLLRNQDARLLYTFHTKSLYQHIRRLITRFYRQFDDRDPDWTRLHIMHAWGGPNMPGVYYRACESLGIPFINYSAALQGDRAQPFEYACSMLLKSATIKPVYDYVFIDEGQDHANSFIRLCSQLADQSRFVIAYDELQTIFQAQAPSAGEIFGVDSAGRSVREFAEDIVLHKCYRNPREVLVCAHAVGFGIYGDRIVQMLENRDHWEDVGYKVISGDFVAGSNTVIERPLENSLASISERNDISEIVRTHVCRDFNDEIKWVADSVKADIEDGLRPDDILVTTVDDRNAKRYLSDVAQALLQRGVRCHNVHAAMFDEIDFQEEGRVTLSTVHKAKGNEAFMVYVMGVDGIYPKPSIRHRNMLFTAMTRAKGWVRVSGIGDAAKICITEIQKARTHFPRLEFEYPSEEELKVMRRDLEESASRRLRLERMLEEAAGDLSDEEIEAVLKNRSSAGRKGRGSKKV